MLTKRIIPCLDIKNGRTVKGVNFLDLKDAGDPLELAKRYVKQGADELVFLDIAATTEKRKTLLELVRKIAREINIPFTVGGGISSVNDVNEILKAGADKVAINSAAIKNPGLIDEVANQFGSQCIVLAIDAKKIENDWIVYSAGGTIMTDLKLFEWAQECSKRGAGEILFTSMSNDGTKTGFANGALACLSVAVNIPIIASGGAGSHDDFIDVFTYGKADAALAASVFHYDKIEIRSLKQELSKSGLAVRL